MRYEIEAHPAFVINSTYWLCDTWADGRIVGEYDGGGFGPATALDDVERARDAMEEMYGVTG